MNLVSFYNIGRIQNASVLGNGGAFIEMLLQTQLFNCEVSLVFVKTDFNGNKIINCFCTIVILLII